MAARGGRMRTFIAVTVSADVRRVADNARRHCADFQHQLRWVAPERIHLTLKFLGDVDSGQVAAVKTQLAATAAAAAPMRLTAKGLGVFPSVKRPRVLWLGTSGDTASLIAFARQLDDGLAARGFTKEKRPFRAHLTLGRFKGKMDPRRLADAMASAVNIGEAAFDVDRVHFFKSDLTPSGAVHTPLAAYPMTAGGTQTLLRPAADQENGRSG